MNRIFNIVSWIGIALVLGAVGIRFGAPAQGQYATYLAWAGLALILLYIASQWREIGGFFGTRSGRYGTLTVTSVLILLGILVAVNYIGKKQNKRWDFTASGQFSLSDQSKNIVQKLDAPLKVLVFDQEQKFNTYRERMQPYEYVSKQVATEYIDPDKKPAAAQENKVQQYGTMIFNYKGRSERTTGTTEQDITNTIIKVVSGKTRKVYFTQGHGEHDTTSSERDGYKGISDALTNENYGVDKLVLAQSAKVPDDASAVIVAGPKSDFFGPEIDALKKYLEANGKLLLMLDPADGPNAAPLTNLIALAHDWGVDVTNTLVVDVSGIGQQLGAGPEMPIAAMYPAHPITERFRQATAFPIARGLTVVSGGVNGHTATSVVESSPQSWAEADLKSIAEGKAVSLDESKGDKPGPITLAAAVSASKDSTPPAPGTPDEPKPETRVAVVGDSDFGGNSMVGFAGNKDLFMNMVGWLSQQENLISIRPREASDRRLKPMGATEQIVLMYGAWLLMPLVVLAVGIFSWSRRR
jgi:ABC-type uncharacterized transport system involved in gliding motility auxiliary subunit